MNTFTPFLLFSYTPSIQVITLGVIAVHALLFLAMALFSPTSLPIPHNKERLIVQTITLQPKQPLLSVETNLPNEAFQKTEIAEVTETATNMGNTETAVKIEKAVEEVKLIMQAEPEILRNPISTPIPAPSFTPTPAPTSIPTPTPKQNKASPASAPTPKVIPSKKIQKQEKKIVPVTPKNIPAKKLDSPVKKTEPQKAKSTEKPKSTEKEIEIDDPKKVAARIQKQALITQAQENIGKIQRTQSKISETKNISSTTLENLSITALDSGGSASSSSREVIYSSELANRLKLFLILPEYGDVDLELTLDRSGKVGKVVILRSDNKVNSNYIEKALQKLTFPPFGINFTDQSQHTFIIKLSNDL